MQHVDSVPTLPPLDADLAAAGWRWRYYKGDYFLHYRHVIASGPYGPSTAWHGVEMVREMLQRAAATPPALPDTAALVTLVVRGHIGRRDYATAAAYAQLAPDAHLRELLIAEVSAAKAEEER